MYSKALTKLSVTASAFTRKKAAQDLLDLVTPLLGVKTQQRPGSLPPSPPLPPSTTDHEKILKAMRHLARSLIPGHPLHTIFHDGEIHDPLGGGSYAFQNDIAGPVLRALLRDEYVSGKAAIAHDADTETKISNDRLPHHPIVIHAGLQPNNSPHVGTLVVFCYAFAFARALRDRMAKVAEKGDVLPSVTVLITFVDTAPVKDQGVQIDGVQYQKSHRDIPEAFWRYMSDYKEVLQFLSTWSGIPVTEAFQSDLFSNPAMPSLVEYMVAQRGVLGPQLSPKYSVLALRSACPVPGCGLAEKHGRFNEYVDKKCGKALSAAIRFRCPHHSPHTIRLSDPTEVARLEANAPTRNLLRGMTHLLDTSVHHIRVTGSDYAGMYQETFLYRPLAAWSAATGQACGRTPHILYAPLIVDWSGAKLSKSLYVREDAYTIMEQLGMDGFCSYAQLRDRFDRDGGRGLRKIWDEVDSWVADPRKLFRTFSLAYMQGVVFKENDHDHGHDYHHQP
ncbi:hypothetical protein GGR50DRAFT_659985 [Xylaria sp. CBS 124048]|nr:hypothetical protein GGR50DRAFT_659985 [Xylaria sp. CBS 124048]